MFMIDKILLLAAVLILGGIFSSKLSARLGLPVLVLFLLVGMLAGEEGIGGITFDSPEIAHALGTLALALILYDGGLQTPIASIKSVWKPSAVLATVGVLVTALVTGLAAAYILDLSLLEGLLIGSIVGSTDAAAVFAQLRNAGVHIKPRLKSILEVESASNDPMAIFLTVGLLEVLMNDIQLGSGMLLLFVQQMGIGAVVGLVVGWMSIRLINRIQLSAAGLYPVLVTACGLLAFGVAANLGGSGFLAVFLAGIVIGNSRFVFQRSTFLFHDGLAWLSQITMFVVLGLLINPHELLDVWWQGLLISIALIFVARPLIVAPVLTFFGFNVRETALVSWVGLRGSVPIILAIFPLMFDLPGAPLIFNVVFFVVLISATVQGSTLPYVARKLGLAEEPPAVSAASLEITSIGDIDAEIVEYTLAANSRAVGRRLSQIALPEGAVVAMITRGSSVITPRGSTILRADDHLFVVLNLDARPFVDQALSHVPETSAHQLLKDVELRLKGTSNVDDVKSSYNILLNVDDNVSLAELVSRLLNSQGAEIAEGASVVLDGMQLSVRDLVGRRLVTIGVLPLPEVPETEIPEAGEQDTEREQPAP